MYAVALIILQVLLGCSDHMIVKVAPRQPEIVVYPEQIDFGHLVSGQETALEEVIVLNAGDEILHIDVPYLEDQVGNFGLIGWSSEHSLEGGELISFQISYDPKTFEVNAARVDIASDDEDEPLIEIPIIGAGDAPVIEVDPTEVDYGTISIGCDNEERITIANTGNLPLTVESVIQMVTQPVDILMEFGALPEPPWVIDPGNELDFLVSYIPDDTGVDSSEIEIISNDPLNPAIEALQYGLGDVEQWVIDQYEQEEIPLLDVLWVIDNSGSMNPFQQAMADNMSLFMQVFLAATPDFHMGFITTDRATLQGAGLIDGNTQNPDSVAASVLSGIGIYGSGHEQGVRYSQMATLTGGEAGPGSTFFREDATLVVIYVSDEPDYSSGGWNSYTSHFSSLKDSDKLHFVSVVGDNPTGCSFSYNGYNRTVPYGTGYIDITNHFGGTIYSLCATDWGNQMEDLADTVSVKRRFSLSEPDPIESTIVVYVNGQIPVGNWAYDANENAVIFDVGQEPEAGDTIEIEYATWGC